ncbi:methyltransferase family protein [Cupriavidus gilardii J11]|uniref:Methyltransferase family protein n=1 Tax=Cupriavidus gilardii J11 TaxID=936133 RepID=A0A562BLA4_9BURK|nr:class I SAM-dependent methyltransferase [Cupriavidus gilardii]TWG85974.1 methyltransferase family protein [Cupriavidus gilardii J11]
MTRWPSPEGAGLVAHAAAWYAPAGAFAQRFARFKLHHDPVFAILLAQGLVPARARILDIGCGQGLLPAWLATASDCHPHSWPGDWPSPPVPTAYVGIELTPADAERARRALCGRTAWPCEIRTADAREALHDERAAYDVVVILDVLHYMEFDAQQAVLRDAVRCLAPGGRLILRVGDASAGWRARYSRAVDRIVQWLRAGRATPLYCRPADEWRRLLRGMGLALREIPLPADAHGANVLMVGVLAESTTSHGTAGDACAGAAGVPAQPL